MGLLIIAVLRFHVKHLYIRVSEVLLKFKISERILVLREYRKLQFYFYRNRLFRNNSVRSEISPRFRERKLWVVTPTTTYWLSGTSGASMRSFIPGDTHFDALLDFSSTFRCTRAASCCRASCRASGISAGCYFKSCQSPVIAPVF